MTARILSGRLATLALALCSSCPAGGTELPRLADARGVDPLVLEKLEPALAACERAKPGAVLELAKLYDAFGMTDLAVRAFRLCLERGGAELGEAPARVHFHLARNLEQSGRAAEALAAFEAALALDGSYPPAHWRAGNLLLDANRIPEAERAFRRALELEPHGVPQRLGLARVHLLLGRPREALDALAPVVERYPRERLVHGLLARAHRALGDEASAREELRRDERALESNWIDPWTAEVNQRKTGVMDGVQKANRALVAGKPGDALAVLEPLHEQAPDDLAVIQMLGKAYVMAERYEDALTLIEQARERYPDQFKLELYAGMAYDGRRNFQRAKKHLERARELNPAYGPTHAALGEVQLKLGELAAAEASLQRALEQGEEDLRTRILFARAEIELAKYASAETVLEQACADFPTNPSAWAHLAESRARRGDERSAREALAEAERLDPAFAQLKKVREILERTQPRAD